jgi:hypothetical protein
MDVFLLIDLQLHSKVTNDYGDDDDDDDNEYDMHLLAKEEKLREKKGKRFVLKLEHRLSFHSGSAWNEFDNVCYGRLPSAAISF